MKTLHLLIIIVASGIVITTVVVLQTPHIQIRIDGLNDTYSVGTPIDFFVTAESYGKFCAGPEVSILDATNQSNEVWWGASPAYTGMYCDLHQEEFTFHAGAHSEFASHTNLPIILNKTGQYIVRAKLGNTFSEKEFSVVLMDSSKTNGLSEKDCGQFYPVPSDNHYNFNETYPVLILKQNSIGCAKLTYTINYKYNDNRSSSPWPQMVIIGERFHIGNYIYTSNGNSYGVSSRDTTNLFETASIPNVIDLSKYPVGSQFIVTYVIKPLSNATGFYDYSVEEVPCVTYPLVVGFSADQINSSDFSKGMVGMHNHSCISAPYAISSVQISDMDFTKIKF